MRQGNRLAKLGKPVPSSLQFCDETIEPVIELVRAARVSADVREKEKSI